MTKTVEHRPLFLQQGDDGSAARQLGDTSGIMERLKHATAQQHARVDAMVDPCLTNRDRYPSVIVGLATATRSVEQAMIRWRDALLEHDFDVDERSKANWLAADERVLGLDRSSLAQFELPSAASAFGAAYVTEGATLGGQVIVRVIESEIGIMPETGSRFFFGYGAETGRMWKRTRASLEEYAAKSSELDEVINGAMATFELFERSLMRAIG